MLKFLFDTDHLTLFDHGHPVLRKKLQSHPPDAVGISVVTVEENVRGRLAAISGSGWTSQNSAIRAVRGVASVDPTIRSCSL